jgi:hypothetical protein
VENPDRKGPLGRPRSIWEKNTKFDIRDAYVDWLDRFHNSDTGTALMKAVINLWLLIKCGEVLEYMRNCGFSRRAVLHGVSYLGKMKDKCLLVFSLIGTDVSEVLSL